MSKVTLGIIIPIPSGEKNEEKCHAYGGSLSWGTTEACLGVSRQPVAVSKTAYRGKQDSLSQWARQPVAVEGMEFGRFLMSDR